MIDKKELIFAVLATFCLTATLFMVVPTKSQAGSYDARTDANGDGSIDMADLQLGIDNFMTYGDPTLPVIIANHTNYENTWIGYFAPGQQLAPVEIPTAGYESVSMTIVIYPPPTTYAEVTVTFTIIGGPVVMLFTADTFQMDSTSWHVSKVYPVSGSTFSVWVHNYAPEQITAMIGVYMLA